MKKQSGKRVIKAFALIDKNGIVDIALKKDKIRLDGTIMFCHSWSEEERQRNFEVIPCTITLKEKGRKL